MENVHRRPYKKFTPNCTTCNGKKLLWLGGKDYVECPDCLGLGNIEIIEERVSSTSKIILVSR